MRGREWREEGFLERWWRDCGIKRRRRRISKITGEQKD
jgi:hypothetical protein